MSRQGRRPLLRGRAGAGLGGVLAGCGFHPIYAPGPKGSLGAAQVGLAAIQVAIIPDRTGQLLRQALQARFEREGAGTAHKYDLFVAYSIASEGLAVEPDSSVTRTRLVGYASWTLLAQDPKRSAVTSGSARSLDGVDVVNNQFFASDLNVETAQRRISETIADQITLQLATYFNRKNVA